MSPLLSLLLEVGCLCSRSQYFRDDKSHLELIAGIHRELKAKQVTVKIHLKRSGSTLKYESPSESITRGGMFMSKNTIFSR
jgi:hypothetical protein